MSREVNKYPFAEISTLRITDLKYTFPMGLLLDAAFTPSCDNNAPFYVSDIIMDLDIAKLVVMDSLGTAVFTIIIPLTQDNGDYVYGYGKQSDGTYCGACLGDKHLISWLKSMPSIMNIPSNSLIFSASAVFATGLSDNGVVESNVRYNGDIVTGISWGDNLTGGKIETETIPVSDDPPPVIKSVTVNGVSITGDNLYITPVKQSSVRVVSTTGLTIGKLSDL